MNIKPHAVALLVGCALLSRPAHAKSTVELEWSYDQVWSAAMRFVRVDRACKVVDKDDGAAFIVFECEGEPGKPPRRGSLELYKIELRGRMAVRAQVTLNEEPRYVELRFLELLERKLREERGPPPSSPVTRPPPPKPDGGV